MFEEWVGKKKKDMLYEIAAYCCLIDYPIHLIFCFIGGGRNGKTKYQQLIVNLIGKENSCSTELDSLLDSRFESSKLYKKLMCIMGETNFGIMKKTSLLKKLVGQDLIGYEIKNKNPFDDYNYAKIIINSNSLPTSHDTSEGFYRRWVIIDFLNEFPEGKDILKIIPKEEYNNFCNKITKILPRILKKGNFIYQGTIKERMKKYISVSNPFSLFIEENCIVSENYKVKYGELYSSYLKYLFKNKRRRVTRKEFGEILDDEGLFREKNNFKGDDGIYYSTLWIIGIKLRDLCDLRDYNLTQFHKGKLQGEVGVHKAHKAHNTNKDTNIQKDTPSLVIEEEIIQSDWQEIDKTYEKCSCGAECVVWEHKTGQRYCDVCKKALEGNK